jgi:hypothetical protein
MVTPTGTTEQGCFFVGSEGCLTTDDATRPAPYENQDDAALANEMNELTVDERNRVLEEVHGVADMQEETPEFIMTCLDQMDGALSKLSYSKRRDWDRATFLKPSLLKDSKFKLMFLRTDNYDGRQAAERLARFFVLKRDLFGEDKLVKNMTLDDLEEEDMTLLGSGVPPMMLPHKDQTGRPIWFCDASKLYFKNTRSVVR